MLEVLQVVFDGAEVKKLKDGIPSGVDVGIVVDKITSEAPDAVTLHFIYSVDYKPGVGQVKMTGDAFCRDHPENIKRLAADFKKKKELSPEHGASAINMINANCGMNAIFLIRPFNMLPPFMPPLLVKQDQAVPSKKK